MPRTIFTGIAVTAVIIGSLAVDADFMFRLAIVFALLAVAYKE